MRCGVKIPLMNEIGDLASVPLCRAAQRSPRRDARDNPCRPVIRLALVSLVPLFFAACSDPAIPDVGKPPETVSLQQPELKQQQPTEETPVLNAKALDAEPATADGEGATVPAADQGTVSVVIEDAADESREGASSVAQEARVLDLVYKPDPSHSASSGQEPTGDGGKKLLPNLFGEKEGDDKVNVSGGVFLDEEQQGVRRSIQGGEVSVEIKTP